jgi:gliding motility-associated-like protein
MSIILYTQCIYPNNDGLNDLFRIPPNVAFTLKDFSIYDSWGRKIFFTTDINRGWDGRANGVMQQTGIYIYTIHGADDKGPVFLKGVFTLLH